MYYAGNETNGAYYTWCNATASKGRYCSGATTTVDDSEYSICPRGWKLPTNTEYSTLLNIAGIVNNSDGSSKIRNMPYNFPYAGIVDGGSLYNVGSYGYYWSSTADDNNYAYYLYFDSGNVGTNSSGRSFGFSVRCIAP